jgi:hypothetical protein
MDAFLEFLKKQGGTIITSALSGGVFSGIIVAFFNWKLNVSKDPRSISRSWMNTLGNPETWYLFDRDYSPERN